MRLHERRPPKQNLETNFEISQSQVDMKVRNVKTITDTRFPLNRDPFVHNNRNGSVYNYIRSSRRQVPREIQPYIKDFPA